MDSQDFPLLQLEMIIIATIIVLIAMTSLYVGAEFAIVSSRKTRVSQLAGSGNRLAQRLLPFLEDRQALDRYVAACQVGITASSLVLGAYGQRVVADRLVPFFSSVILLVRPELGGDAAGASAAAQVAAQSVTVTVVLIGLTTFHVVLGELLPKSLALQFPERLAMATIIPMKWSLFIFRPFIWFFNGSGNLILRLLGFHRASGHAHVHSPEEIEILVSESHQGGLLDDEERVMLRNAFRMRELTARQVMVHRTRIVAAPVQSSVRELMQRSLEAGISRIPLYKDSIDNIIGFVHVKDLLRLHVQAKENLAEILREVIYVPESLSVNNVWETLGANRQYMAVVFDEYGGTAGVITFEDLIEEIFGELQDEFDDETALISLDKEGRIYLRADLLVTDVNEYLALSLPADAADTLGGLVLSELGHPAEVGDEVAVGDATIRVESLAALGVAEVSLQTTPENGLSNLGEWEVVAHD